MVFFFLILKKTTTFNYKKYWI